MIIVNLNYDQIALHATVLNRIVYILYAVCSVFSLCPRSLLSYSAFISVIQAVEVDDVFVF